jgi:2-polyprenyl-3-methyl-5-hydroxy-6-metoxy-1,4-benzoquinol methylase
MSIDNEGKNYDKIASGFAKMRDSFNTEKKYLDLFIEYLQPQSHLLDVGCGSGYPIASYLIENNFQITGVDASIELLKIAKNNCPLMECVHGDIRSISLDYQYDGIIEWWCLFHLPKVDHAKMIARFAGWLKKGGILEFTTGDSEYEGCDNNMLGQELCFYSLNPKTYEKYLQKNNFKILLRENDQEQHMVWIARKEEN